MNKKNQVYLLTLARRSLKQFLETKDYLQIDQKNLPSADLLKKQGTFVTLTINGQLRGCIGHIEPINPIYIDIIENAVSSAFHDPRFYPLIADELNRVKVEISLLSVPEDLDYTDDLDLVSKLEKEKPGVILGKGDYQATFLPQVWEDLKNPQEFLSHLCLKAGLSKDEWKKGELSIQTYKVEVFHE